MMITISSLLLPLAILNGLALVQGQAEQTPALTVEGLDGKKTVFSLEQLKQMPHQEVTAVESHSKATRQYEGVLLSALLNQAGVPAGAKLHGVELRDYLVAVGSDNYAVVFSLAELDPTMQENGGAVVAYASEGMPFDAKQGPLKLVVPRDQSPDRAVRMLIGITIRRAP